jgi:guanosine-3',5'-bis(diphosphate) 3'-pyrophosphohydrolase
MPMPPDLSFSTANDGLVLRALHFAAERHRDQRRKGSDHAPYVNHLIDVLDLLWRVGGVRDAQVLAAGLLHDVLEDTPTTPVELTECFGQAVYSLVREVTDDKRLPPAQRKQQQVEHAAQLSSGAKWIKLADKISNVRDVNEHPPEGWPAERCRAYRAWSAQVVEQLRGANPALEAEFERVLPLHNDL